MRDDILESKSQILQWINENRSKAYMCKQLHCKQETLNSYLQKMEIEYAGQQVRYNQIPANKKTVKEYLASAEKIKSNTLKYKILEEGIKEYKCEYCERTEWNGLPIPLELHHIDGDHYNNNLSNLMIVCPNCHAQLTSQQSVSQDSYTYKNYIGQNQKGSSEQKNKERKKQNKCIDCGKPILSKSVRCVACAYNHRSSCPYNREELKKLIRESNFRQIGKTNNVSDNTVRKWCKKFGLPTKSRLIKQYTDSEWKSI